MDSKPVKIKVKAKPETDNTLNTLWQENTAITDLYIKQLKKTRILSICLVIVLIVAGAAGTWAYNEIAISHGTAELLAADIIALEDKLEKENAEWSDTFENYTKAMQERDFYKGRIKEFAIVFPGEKVYHYADCPKFSINKDAKYSGGNAIHEFIAYDHDYISKRSGYSACRTCHDADWLREGSAANMHLKLQNAKAQEKG